MNAHVSTAFSAENYAKQSRLPISLRLMPSASLLCAVESKDDVSAATKEVVAMKDMVAYLRDGLPISAIAEIMNVERKTVYSWLDGVAPREYHAARVEAMFSLISENTADLKSLYRVWNRPIAGGATLRLMLSAKPFNERAIKDALIALGPEMAQHAARDAARRPPLPDARNPLIDEMPEAGSAE